MEKKGPSDDQDDVGYKKPPRHSQFQAGKSGNPNGRPKKTEDVADVLHKELNVLVPILQNGKRRRISKLRAIVRQNLNKAANGDPRASTILFNALKSHKPESTDTLGALLEEFRAIDRREREAELNKAKSTVQQDGGRDSKADIKHQ